MTTLGTIHVTAALVAIVLGAVVLLDAKGTLAHRMLGAGYVLAMLTVNLSTLGLYHMLGTVGPFHVLAAISFIVLMRGVVPLVRRRGDWLGRHYRYMSGSYIGLLAAATAEATVRVPAARALIQSTQQGILVSIGIAIVFAVLGRVLIPRMERRVLSRA